MLVETTFFYFFTAIVIFASIMVIGSPNPIHSVLFLILVFCNMSALLIMLETEFLALIFLVIYVGAIAVLFLFVVMMLNINLAELNENILRYLPIGGVIGIIFLIEILSTLPKAEIVLTSTSLLASLPTNIEQPADWIAHVAQLNNIEIFGLVIYTHYFYLFIIASFVLLVAMVGAITLTIQTAKNIKRQDIVDQLLRETKTTVVNWTQFRGV